jgi:hypothetical protein
MGSFSRAKGSFRMTSVGVGAGGPIHLGRRTAEGGCPHMSCGSPCCLAPTDWGVKNWIFKTYGSQENTLREDLGRAPGGGA